MAKTLTVVEKQFPRGPLYVLPDVDAKSAYQNLTYNKHMSPANKTRLAKLGVRFDVVSEDDYDGELNLDQDFRPEGQRR